MEEMLLSSDTAKETLMYLSFFDKTLLEVIPNEMLKMLNELASSSDKEYYILEDKKLNEQSISSESKDLISMLYYLYSFTDEDKNYIEQRWLENES